MEPIQIAVIGAGKLGGYHANLAAKLPEFDLVAIADPWESSRNALASKTGAEPVANIAEVFDRIEAAVVATPTATHYAVVDRLLAAGKHVLVEKPITPTADAAARLVQTADKAGVTLQVGHVERFSPALVAAGDSLKNPRFIRSERTSGYTFRSTDIGAVLDLMIHDIDLVLSLAESEVVDVWATGLSVLGGHEDMVNARLTFANGCVADLTASRVSYELRRTMQVITDRGFTAVDFATGKATTVAPTDAVLRGEFNGDALSAERKAELFAGKMFEEVLVKAEHAAPAVNAIELELLDFARAIQTGTSPRVNGAAGRDAVAIAERVLRAIASQPGIAHQYRHAA
ncbi:Dehydrogenase [Botrimarina colliarenosi]|uniref:Dehydrogenase n=1 Tax=Botrimarina colliarenosi TaxID=2528001 RepID=A0A5C6A7D7_9BACT|nr:Gfo/Idh/MocA family oxidoreductase [Botrimarina colliarenosi]TWT95922.1 Dehydrogenase [Botrimarina colliarenosi]